MQPQECWIARCAVLASLPLAGRPAWILPTAVQTVGAAVKLGPADGGQACASCDRLTGTGKQYKLLDNERDMWTGVDRMVSDTVYMTDWPADVYQYS